MLFLATTWNARLCLGNSWPQSEATVQRWQWANSRYSRGAKIEVFLKAMQHVVLFHWWDEWEGMMGMMGDGALISFLHLRLFYKRSTSHHHQLTPSAPFSKSWMLCPKTQRLWLANPVQACRPDYGLKSVDITSFRMNTRSHTCTR